MGSVVSQITGKGITSSVSMEAADLGIARWDESRQAIAVMFGDNFEFEGMKGTWFSPSIVMYDKDFRVLGIPSVVSSKPTIVENAVRNQLWPYPHNNEVFSTILPTDFIKLGEWWYVYVMVTKGLGNEVFTGWRRSQDLVVWEPMVTLDVTRLHPGQVMLTFDQFEDYIYIAGTGGLARSQPIWMWRCKLEDFPLLSSWELLNSGSPILGGQYGELCLRNIQGNAVLSFFDSAQYRQSAITVQDPNGDWSSGNRVDYAFGSQIPQLYGGYISPFSRLNVRNGMDFLVSQWNTSTNNPYRVLLVEDTLLAQGPLVEIPAVKPEETPVTDTPVDETEVDDLITVLVKELSASGSVAILDSDGNKRSLREALEAIHWKEITELTLHDRPRSPKLSDDQYGHVLNSRAEGLMTLALLDRLVKSIAKDIETDSVYDQVRRSFQ